MARKSHLLIFCFTILFSSIFPICHSSYFLKEHEIRSQNKYYSPSNDIEESYNDDLDPQELANYDKVIIERIKNSHQAQSKALISSLSSSKIVNVEHFVRSRKIKDDTKVTFFLLHICLIGSKISTQILFKLGSNQIINR